MSEQVIKAAHALVAAISRPKSPVLSAIYADKKTEEALTKLEEALGSAELSDDAEVTGGQAARLFDVSRQTVSKWRERGLIKPVGEGNLGRGGYLYRVGDLRRAARQ
jgi:hypothetical protein